ncbi:MAG: class I SAM-dependent methyltransferase [Oscillospiraceae bacterium]|nr:class I SAM-dependent methyltransferase [Oscillospiraceae bacterium]
MSSYCDFASVYDVFTSNIDYHRRTAYYDRQINAFGGKKGILLDLACGTGSMSFEFAKLGYDVIGIDGSEEMLSAAMDKKLESGIDSVIFLCQQMQELDLYGTVDVTVCALDSLNHLTELKDLQDAFQRVSLFTNPGGLFLFDVNTLYKHQEILGNNTFFYDEPGASCIWQNTFIEPDTVQIDLDFFIEAEHGLYRRTAEQFQERAYTDEILCSTLKKAGFSVLAVYDEDSETPPHDTSERIIYIAKKI